MKTEFMKIIDIKEKILNYKKSIVFGLTAIFLTIVWISFLYINTDSSVVVEKMQSKMPLDVKVLTPEYVSNAEKYESKEEIGGLDEKLLKKVDKDNKKSDLIRKTQRDQVAENPLDEKDANSTKPNDKGTLSGLIKKENPVDSANKNPQKKNVEETKKEHTQSDANAKNVLPPYILSNGKCYQVAKPELFALVKSESEIQYLNDPAWWKVKNTSDRAVSILIKQSNINILVAFIPAKSTLETRIPASHLQFNLRSNMNNCIDWFSGPVNIGSLPSMKANDTPNVFKNGVFETVVFSAGDKINLKTSLLGYTE